MIDMEENGKNTGTSLISSGYSPLLREPKVLFLPSVMAGSTAILHEDGRHNPGKMPLSTHIADRILIVTTEAL